MGIIPQKQRNVYSRIRFSLSFFHAAAADSSRRLRSGGFLCCFTINVIGYPRLFDMPVSTTFADAPISAQAALCSFSDTITAITATNMASATIWDAVICHLCFCLSHTETRGGAGFLCLLFSKKVIRYNLFIATGLIKPPQLPMQPVCLLLSA